MHFLCILQITSDSVIYLRLESKRRNRYCCCREANLRRTRPLERTPPLITTASTIVINRHFPSGVLIVVSLRCLPRCVYRKAAFIAVILRNPPPLRSRRRQQQPLVESGRAPIPPDLSSFPLTSGGVVALYVCEGGGVVVKNNFTPK